MVVESCPVVCVDEVKREVVAAPVVTAVLAKDVDGPVTNDSVIMIK